MLGGRHPGKYVFAIVDAVPGLSPAVGDRLNAGRRLGELMALHWETSTLTQAASA